MSATATKISKAQAAAEHAQRSKKTQNILLEERLQTLELSEQLLRDLQGRSVPSPEEMSVFHSMGWGLSEFRRERERVAAVIELQDRAGLHGKLESAQQIAAQADEALSTEGQSIRDQITALEVKLEQLAATADQANEVVSDMLNARSLLRQNVPTYLKQHHELKAAQIEECYGDLTQTRARLKAIEGILTLNPSSSPSSEEGQAIRLHLEVAPLAPADNPLVYVSAGLKSVDAVKWNAYADQLEREREELLSKLKPLDECRRVEMAEVDAILDYYIKENSPRE